MCLRHLSLLGTLLATIMRVIDAYSPLVSLEWKERAADLVSRRDEEGGSCRLHQIPFRMVTHMGGLISGMFEMGGLLSVRGGRLKYRIVSRLLLVEEGLVRGAGTV